MKIAIFGLGYVGTVTGACLAARGHSIVGVDVHRGKVEAFGCGKPPIVEPGVVDLLLKAKQESLLGATTSASDAVRATDLAMVCVGTPSTLNGGLDLSFVKQVVTEIRQALDDEPRPYALVVRSTLLPGSMESLVEADFAALLATGQVEVVYYPEFLREGSAIVDFEDPSLVVIGTQTGRPPLEGPVSDLLPANGRVLPWHTAELVKYASNAFHATKITFANEVGRLAKTLGVDARVVMDLLCTDTKLNLSSSYLRPGNPFGGSCLPKDLRALVRRSRQLNADLPMLESLLTSNQRHLESLMALITRTGHRQVVILGMTFKLGTDDLRESAMVEVAQTLLGRGYELRIYDPTLDLRELTGSNKRLIEARLPHLASLLHQTLGEAVGEHGVILAAQRITTVDELASHVTAAHHIIDINGWPELSALEATYEGLCW